MGNTIADVLPAVMQNSSLENFSMTVFYFQRLYIQLQLFLTNVYYSRENNSDCINTVMNTSFCNCIDTVVIVFITILIQLLLFSMTVKKYSCDYFL